MNLLDLMVKIGVDDQASAGIEKIAGGIKSGLGAAATAAAAGVAAATGAAAALTTASVSAYANYQQLTGGVETLFGTSADKLMAYAETAYQAAGMSANTYMETATSFSASLLQGLGGDTAAAVEIANMAITDMSDNANKMGTDINSIRDAYQGFAKDNYDMLDNLKLGYGGTASEMARLINESGVLGDSMQVTAETVKDVPFDQMIEAIHQVQDEMGITGTTALEASTTIEGSINTAKAAWENWLAGMANQDADMSVLTDQLVQSVIVAGENIVPAVGTVMTNLGAAIQEQLPGVIEQVSAGLQGILPPDLYNTLSTLGASLMGFFTQIQESMSQVDFGAIFSGLSQAATALAPVFQTIADIVVNYLIPNFAALAAAVGPLVAALAPVIQVVGTALLGAFNNIVVVITNVVTWLTNFITNVQQIPGQVGAAVNGIVTWFQELPGKIAGFLSQVISDLMAWASDVASQAAEAGSQFLQSIQDGFNSAVEWVSSIPGQIVSALGDLGTLLWDAGSSIINGLWEGMQSAIGGVFDWVGGIASDIAALKGPLPYDRKVLIPNGIALMQGLQTGMEKGLTKALKVASTTAGDVAEAVSSGTDVASSAMRRMAEDMADAAESTVRSVSEASDEVARSFSVISEEIDQAKVDEQLEAINEAIEGGDGVISAFVSGGRSAEDFAVDLVHFGTTVDEVRGKVTSFANSVNDGFSTISRRASDVTLTDYVKNLRNNIEEAGEWADDVAAVFSKVADYGPAQAFKEMVISGGIDQWGRIMMQLSNKTREEIIEVVDLYNSATQAGMDAGVKMMDALIPDAVTQEQYEAMGRAVTDGMAEGIADGTDAVTGAVKTMCKAVDDTITGYFGIASPSKLMYGYGVNDMEGFRNGIRSMVPDVVRAMEGAMADVSSVRADLSPVVRDSKYAAQLAGGSRPIVRETGDVYNFYNLVKTPYETARAIRMQKTYGLAGAR